MQSSTALLFQRAQLVRSCKLLKKTLSVGWDRTQQPRAGAAAAQADNLTREREFFTVQLREARRSNVRACRAPLL